MQRLSKLNLKSSPLMPVLFVGHGSPMNAIEDNEFTKQWQSVASKLPEPQAIVVISAHWQTLGTHITDAPKQKIIYDMYGFPDELYAVEYPADGSPDLAGQLLRHLHKYEAKLDSTWGLDHGTWSVLVHIAPHPTVPILQISLDMNLSLEGQYEVFRSLRPFREKGVLFIGSGNIVHNLRMAKFDMQNAGYDWGVEFDDFARKAIESGDIARLLTPEKFTSSFLQSVPTDEHYRPLLASMGLVDNPRDVSFFAEGMVAGSISMRSLLLT